MSLFIILELILIILTTEIIRKKEFSIFRMIFLAIFPLLIIMRNANFNLFAYGIFFLSSYLSLTFLDHNPVTSFNITSLSFLLVLISKQISYFFLAYFGSYNFFDLYYPLSLSIFSFSIASLLRRIYTEKHLRTKDIFYKIITTVFIQITFLLFFYQFVLPEFSLMKVEFSPEVNFMLLTAYGLLALISIAAVYNHSLNKRKQQEQQIENEFLHLYLENLEEYQRQINEFKHDYKNILLSIEYYLKEEDLKGLKTFFYNDLQNTITEKQPVIIQGLTNLKIKEIHGLLLSKFNYMIQKKIPFIFCCEEEIKDLPCNLISIIRILGILLDNAIEEVSTLKQGNIQVSFYYKEKDLYIEIVNTCREYMDPLFKLKSKGYTTKTSGKGLGLSIVEDLKNKEKNILMETKIENNTFSQTLILLGV